MNCRKHHVNKNTGAGAHMDPTEHNNCRGTVTKPSHRGGLGNKNFSCVRTHGQVE